MAGQRNAFLYEYCIRFHLFVVGALVFMYEFLCCVELFLVDNTALSTLHYEEHGRC